eukprot:CAMPEP_0183742214 /NCGR_PEP_ID=MMETSP0737-20130205/64204_1 /TAXON_ID=385413 /ORGANISM="Thalassiosira miniscula, Strain CCMP1093" /LENGTH=194 /DNA_ID=CAMNT_0025977765 /DNA_START=120 /DNA_END=703 /DNA_ORIENTATION=-
MGMNATMLLNPKVDVARCSVEGGISAHDCVESGHTIQVIDVVREEEANIESNPAIDMTVISKHQVDHCQTRDMDPALQCSDLSLDAKTAEWSISSGESFISREASPRGITLCSQRSILRAESRIFDPPMKPPHLRKRKISFGTVSVRDYGIILGDHPCCSYGPPITIDWDYHQHEALDVDVYEFENALSSKEYT